MITSNSSIYSLEAFSDDKLRIACKRALTLLSIPTNETEEFKADVTRYAEGFIETGATKRKSVAYTWAILDEVNGLSKRCVTHESPETKEWSSMEATYSHWTDNDHYNANLARIFA
jgi:hypothetical protein